MLAGEGQNALDDHVVERDRLHERLQVVGTAGQPVDSALEHLVEELVEPGVTCLPVSASRPCRVSASRTPTSSYKRLRKRTWRALSAICVQS
jgi:hypothetical protein